MDCVVDKFISQFNIWRPDQCHLGYVQLEFGVLICKVILTLLFHRSSYSWYLQLVYGSFVGRIPFCVSNVSGELTNPH